MEITTALQGTGEYQILFDHIISSSIFFNAHVRPLFADKEKTMARQTTKKIIETPEFTFDDLPKVIQDEVKDKVSKMSVHEVIKHEHGLDALRAEIDRLNWVIRQKDLTINALQKGNEKLSDELSKARNDSERIPETI